MSALSNLKRKIKRRDTRVTRLAYRIAKGVLTFDMPPVAVIYQPLHATLSALSSLAAFLLRTFYFKPVFLMKLANRPKRMTYGGVGLPLMLGPLRITMGDDCRIAARMAFIGRAAGVETPELVIGNNVGIGWQCGLYVGTRIKLGDNVRLAEQCTLTGFPGHPMDARARALGEADLDSQAKPIVLEDDVWLGRGVTVNAGVRIGEGTVVASGSVVTRDLPAGVLAGGVPCKVIRKIDIGQTEDLKLAVV